MFPEFILTLSAFKLPLNTARKQLIGFFIDHLYGFYNPLNQKSPGWPAARRQAWISIHHRGSCSLEPYTHLSPPLVGDQMGWGEGGAVWDEMTFIHFLCSLLPQRSLDLFNNGPFNEWMSEWRDVLPFAQHCRSNWSAITGSFVQIVQLLSAVKCSHWKTVAIKNRCQGASHRSKRGAGNGDVRLCSKLTLNALQQIQTVVIMRHRRSCFPESLKFSAGFSANPDCKVPTSEQQLSLLSYQTWFWC